MAKSLFHPLPSVRPFAKGDRVLFKLKDCLVVTSLRSCQRLFERKGTGMHSAGQPVLQDSGILAFPGFFSKRIDFFSFSFSSSPSKLEVPTSMEISMEISQKAHAREKEKKREKKRERRVRTMVASASFGILVRTAQSFEWSPSGNQ